MRRLKADQVKLLGAAMSTVMVWFYGEWVAARWGLPGLSNEVSSAFSVIWVTVLDYLMGPIPPTIEVRAEPALPLEPQPPPTGATP